MGLKVSKVDETSEGAVSNAGTLNAKAGNTDLKLKKDQTTTVEGGKTLTFTAVPVSADFMVAGWYVNGKKVENELSNTCVIEELDKKVHVTVQFTQYKGYALPVSGEGYVLSEKKYAVIANTKKTAYTDKKRTPGTVYRYLVKAYGVSLNKKVIYGQVSNCASAVTRPQTPKITSVKKAGTTKAAIQLKTERNVKGYQLYEYMWQTKKFKLVGKIEGKKYYKYDSKKKKFTRDRKSKVVQNAKKKTISVKITTNNVNFKRYRRYRFKVHSYVKYNGKQIFSKLSKQKIVTR